MLVAFRSSAGTGDDGNPLYAEEELTPSTGVLGVYFLLQACKQVSVYGFSLDDSRRTTDMKAEGLRQGLTLVHFSAQAEPFLVTEATTAIHFPD